MKQLFRSMWAVAAAATLLVGCSKDATETPAPAAGEFTLNFVTSSDTRTEIYDLPDNGGVNIRWSEGDVADFYIDAKPMNSTASITNNAGDPGNIATFPVTVKFDGAAPTFYDVNAQAVYPRDARARYEINDNKTGIKAFGLKLPATQSATTATFDKDADILVAKNMTVEINQDEIVNNTITVEGLSFGRTTAITRIGFKVTNEELTTSEEKVKSISLAVENETEAKMLAGRFAFDPAAFEYIVATKNSDSSLSTDLTPVASRNNIFYELATNKVTVELTDAPALKSGFNAWISTAPVSLAAGDKLVFTVTTDAGTTITKTANISKDLAFMPTKLNKMGVTLDNNVTIDKPAVADATATLTNDDIIANATTAISSYGAAAVTLNATDGSVWSFSGVRKKSGNYLQLNNKGGAHIALPTVSGPIQKIVLTVGSGSQEDPAGGGNGAKYYFRSKVGGTNIVTADGDSKVELDLTGQSDDYTTGYIQVGGATHVFDITVYYVSGSSSTEPQIIAQDVTVPAVGANDLEATYTINNINNSTEDVLEEPEVDGSVVTYALAGQGSILYNVSNNFTAETREGWIKLSTASGLTKTIKVTQQASTLTVSAESITIADGATTATFTVTSPEFNWYITVPEGLGLSVTPELEAASDKAVTVTVTYDGTATGEIGQLTVWRIENNDPQQKTVAVSKQEPVVQGTQNVTFNFSLMGYSNEQVVTEATKTPILISIDATDSTADPAYFDNGSALRVYKNSTFTIGAAADAASPVTITKLEFTFHNSTAANISTSGYNTSDSNTGTWIGSEPSVTFNVSATTRIQTIKVTYDGPEPGPEKLLTPEVNATQDGTSVTLSWNPVDNATKYAYTIGTESGETTETTVTVPMTEGTYNWSVTAIGNGQNFLNSADATGSIEVKAPVVGGDEITITLPLSQNIFDLPTSKTSAETEISKTYEGYTYKLKAGEGCYYFQSKALMLGKADSYITFPAIPEYKLASVKASNCAGASGSGKIVVCPTDNKTAIAGGDAKSIPAGGTTTWTLTGSEANTAYRLYITNKFNVQYTEIVLTYTK